ncbi:hypothetical protein ACLS0R_14985 [Comamonas jiangduensis]|uniref:hypothetical protein n=1 Tax=Comamonas jiangduensis TaxID=1194168 RepID=UPI003BF7ED5F
MSFLMSELVGLWLLAVLLAWVIYEVRDDLKWRLTDSLLFAKFATMHSIPKDPHKEQDPAPEPIDPPNDDPPVELPGDPLDKPSV